MADGNEYNCIDSRAIRVCALKKDNFIQRYANISTHYDQAINVLSQNWKGKSADLFIDDARVIRKNIAGIADILSCMCSTLDDLLKQYINADKELRNIMNENIQEQ